MEVGITLVGMTLNIADVICSVMKTAGSSSFAIARRPVKSQSAIVKTVGHHDAAQNVASR